MAEEVGPGRRGPTIGASLHGTKKGNIRLTSLGASLETTMIRSAAEDAGQAALSSKRPKLSCQVCAKEGKPLPEDAVVVCRICGFPSHIPTGLVEAHIDGPVS